MAISRSKKEQVVSNLADQIKSAKSVAFAQYRGISVSDMEQLRITLRASGAQMTIAKKTLLQRASETNNITIDRTLLEGPVATVFSTNDEIAGPKAIADFAKEHKGMELVGGIMDNAYIDATKIKQLAAIPSQPELIAMMLSSMNAPISGIVQVLAGPIRGLAQVLDQIRLQKEAA